MENIERIKIAAISKAERASEAGYPIEAFFTLYHFNLAALTTLLEKSVPDPGKNNGKGLKPAAKKWRKAQKARNEILLKKHEMQAVNNWITSSKTYLKTLRSHDPGKIGRLLNNSRKVALLLGALVAERGPKNKFGDN